MKFKNEDQIEEWYKKELDKLLDEYIHGVKQNIDHSTLEHIYKEKWEKLKIRYQSLYEELFNYQKKKKAKKVKGHKQKPFEYLKIVKENLKTKLDKEKLVIDDKKFLAKNKLDLFLFKFKIKYKNALDYLHLSYPIFYMKRSFRINSAKSRLFIAKSKAKISKNYHDFILFMSEQFSKFKAFLIKQLKKIKLPKLKKKQEKQKETQQEKKKEEPEKTQEQQPESQEKAQQS